MKSKAAVVALCVCVILAILGVVLGKSPALENTELPPSVSEKILSSQEIWMAITTIFSFLTFPELMGANPFYFLMLAHPAGGSHHQAVSVLISTIVYAALGIGGYFMAGRKRDIF